MELKCAHNFQSEKSRQNFRNVVKITIETHIEVNKHKNKSEDAALELNSRKYANKWSERKGVERESWIDTKWIFLWHFLCNQSAKVFFHAEKAGKA